MSAAAPQPLAGLRLAGNQIVAAAFASIYLLGAARLLGPIEFSDVAVCLSLSHVGLLFLGPLNLTLIRFSAAYRSNNDAAQVRPLLHTCDAAVCAVDRRSDRRFDRVRERDCRRPQHRHAPGWCR